jgi:hypothetical protein
VSNEDIVQIPAEDLDPYSDLGGINVTTAVGQLNAALMHKAIGKARQKAEKLNQEAFIVGAFIALENVIMISEGLFGTIPLTDKIGHHDQVR